MGKKTTKKLWVSQKKESLEEGGNYHWKDLSLCVLLATVYHPCLLHPTFQLYSVAHWFSFWGFFFPFSKQKSRLCDIPCISVLHKRLSEIMFISFEILSMALQNSCPTLWACLSHTPKMKALHFSPSLFLESSDRWFNCSLSEKNQCLHTFIISFLFLGTDYEKTWEFYNSLIYFYSFGESI